MQRVTRRPWFGPRKYLGWGWSPATWEGVVVTVVMVGLLIANPLLFHLGVVGTVAILAVFFVIALLTGGKPGGPGH